MTEPVGNSPRNPGDIPGNSHKIREIRASENAPEPPEEVKKIISGEVKTRKPPWYKRLARGLVADDAQSIGDYLMTEVVLPSIRNLIADTVRGSTERLLFGSSRPRGRRGERESLRTRYDLMGEEPRRLMSRESRSRHDFAEITLDSRAEAIDVIDSLEERIERYGAASVADMYDMLGVSGSYADRNYGWKSLRDADVRQTRGGWLLDLPRPELLR